LARPLGRHVLKQWWITRAANALPHTYRCPAAPSAHRTNQPLEAPVPWQPLLIQHGTPWPRYLTRPVLCTGTTTEYLSLFPLPSSHPRAMTATFRVAILCQRSPARCPATPPTHPRAQATTQSAANSHHSSFFHASPAAVSPRPFSSPKPLNRQPGTDAIIIPSPTTFHTFVLCLFLPRLVFFFQVTSPLFP
jgi:hypothetical protein